MTYSNISLNMLGVFKLFQTFKIWDTEKILETGAKITQDQ